MIDFKECAACAAKPGSPTLCEACLHNRDLVARLARALEYAASRRLGAFDFDEWAPMVEAALGQAPALVTTGNTRAEKAEAQCAILQATLDTAVRERDAARHAYAGLQKDHAEADEAFKRASKELEELRSRLDTAQHRVDELRRAIDRDRTGLARALAEIRTEVAGMAWILEGRGNYEWDDDDYRREAGWMMERIEAVARGALTASGELANAAVRGEPLPPLPPPLPKNAILEAAQHAMTDPLGYARTNAARLSAALALVERQLKSTHESARLALEATQAVEPVLNLEPVRVFVKHWTDQEGASADVIDQAVAELRKVVGS